MVPWPMDMDMYHVYLYIMDGGAVTTVGWNGNGWLERVGR